MAPKRDSKDEGPSLSGGAVRGNGKKKNGSGPDAKGLGKALASPGAQSPKIAAQSSRTPGSRQRSSVQRAIPDAVANRMARRSAIASGFPTVLVMGVFVASYLLVTRDILDIPPAATLLASGSCFLLGLVGLSYGVISSSWEDQAGSLLGTEQIRLNVSRLRESIRSMRQPGSGDTRG